MILTGKCQEDFLNKYGHYEYEIDDVYLNALIIEWFDSIGLWSEVVTDTLILDKFYFANGNWQNNMCLLIITANEIYNEKEKNNKVCE